MRCFENIFNESHKMVCNCLEKDRCFYYSFIINQKNTNQKNIKCNLKFILKCCKKAIKKKINFKGFLRILTNEKQKINVFFDTDQHFIKINPEDIKLSDIRITKLLSHLLEKTF